MNNHEFIDDILNRQKQEIDSFFSQKANIKAMEVLQRIVIPMF